MTENLWGDDAHDRAIPKIPGPRQPEQPSEAAAAISVALDMLAEYGDATGFDINAYAQAHGALTETVRILLRALGAEPTTEALSEIPDTPPRCPAAHPTDPTPCGGPVVVTVLDRFNGGANGCEHHAARLLASLDGGRVYPLPDAPDGAAIRVFYAAGDLPPFCWIERGEDQ